MVEPHKILSVVGMSCPIPLIQLAKSVQTMESGQLLSITGDDPLFENGVRDFCESHHYEVIDVVDYGNKQKLTIKL